ncbi:Mur ligase family protein [Candidatus Dependentiae bacterium]
MKTIKQTEKKTVALGKQRSYSEVVEFLDKNWTTNTQDKSLSCIKQLDKALGNVSKKLKVATVSGTNGKSLTIHFAAKLLREEGLKVGTFYSPHIMTYNERFSINNETVANKVFTEVANEVLNAAESDNLQANTLELLTMIALVYFSKNNVDVAVLEVTEGGISNAVNICDPKITAVTRITPDKVGNMQEMITDIMGVVRKDTWVISADQCKFNLQTMQNFTENKGGNWAMPIRKLAPLSYPFEQLHGRCAALAERIAHIFVNKISSKHTTVVSGTLLTKPKAQRGRPTLEAKRQSELNPRKTVEQFWKDEQSTLPARFQLLDKEKPSVLLDNSSNLDSFQNLLLGIRLLHYQKPLKGLTVILGGNNPDIDLTEFLKLLRYFFKKTSGQVIVCPVEAQPGVKGSKSWDVEKITNDIKSMKIKAKSSKSFKEAFDLAQKAVDERHGLVAITGSTAVISEYWRYKGMKKIA